MMGYLRMWYLYGVKALRYENYLVWLMSYSMWYLITEISHFRNNDVFKITKNKLFQIPDPEISFILFGLLNELF